MCRLSLIADIAMPANYDRHSLGAGRLSPSTRHSVTSNHSGFNRSSQTP
jgi:hypothetical protein